MTIQAQLSNRPQATPQSADRPTLGLDSQHHLGIDAFALLDNRTRSATVSRDLAPPGRYLEVEHGDEVRLIPLERPLIHIGRGLTSDVRLEDLHVSRRHAIIAQRGDGVRVLDDRSSTGTFVNGRKVTVSYLSDGDVLRFGRAVLRFVDIGDQPRKPPVQRLPLPVRTRQVSPDAAA
jgi:pSer/pThr/pTyr-binding forkhead associated (FHA) protein